MERTTSAPRSTTHDILRRRRFRAAILAIIPHTLTESERQWLPIVIRPEAVAKRGEHVGKNTISFFLCSAGFFYYEILPEGTAVTVRVFCEQLREMVSGAPVSHRMQGKFLILMSHARPHQARATAEELERLGITWLPYPPYSPDLSPCGYHASRTRTLQVYLKGKKFHNRQEVKGALDEWIASRSSSFWMNGISALPSRWRDVVAKEGYYLDYDLTFLL
uniref:Transposase n=1 Tax=Haemonchus contortus TaxID=6289 RepID=A0A7I4XRN2_HAECO